MSNPKVVEDLAERKDCLKTLFDRKRKNYKDEWIDVVINETTYLGTGDFLKACEDVGHLDLLPDDLGKAIKRKYYENLPEKEIRTPFTCGTCVDGIIEILFKSEPLYRHNIFCGCPVGGRERGTYLSSVKGGGTESHVEKKLNEGEGYEVTEGHLLFVKGLVEEKKKLIEGEVV